MNLADVMRLESKRDRDAKLTDQRLSDIERRLNALEGKKIVPRETLSLKTNAV